MEYIWIVFLTAGFQIFMMFSGTDMAHPRITAPKALTVDCESLGNREEFKHRLKLRQEAEDQTTIWLFQGEELTIHFELPQHADLEILDVRYSNDGDWDKVALTIDGKEIGSFMTIPHSNWGKQWNTFESSGAIGGLQSLEAGNHTVTLKILMSDFYGLEVDYIRFNVHGSVMKGLDRHDFMCVHNPGLAKPRRFPMKVPSLN